MQRHWRQTRRSHKSWWLTAFRRFYGAVGLISLILWPVLQTGCAGGPRPAQREHQLLAGHPLHETRMAASPETGYTPSGVWRIRGPHCTVYLAGTCHLITPDQIPFPSPFYAAYNDSREVYLEVVDSSSFIGQTRMLFKMMRWIKAHRAELICPPGWNLAHYLAPETIAQLKAHYGKRKYAQREHMTPVLLCFLGDAEALADQYTTSGGVEDVFSVWAHRDGKPLRALDDKSVEEVAFLFLDEMLLEIQSQIAREGPDAVVREKVLGTAKEIEETDWRTGDLAAVEREIQDTRSEAPVLYEKVGPERNRKWLSKLKAALQSDRNVMVLVGVAHLGGADGLLELLKKEGYRPEQMFGVDTAVSAQRHP